MLLVSRPSIGTEELQRVKEVFESGWLGHGSIVLEFENRLKTYLGAGYVVAVNTGTSALHLALDAIGVAKGDEVIVPSLTFCASVQAITALGATPVFCEVSPRTLNVDVADVRKRITSRTRAIMPVHFCGNACDMDALLDIGRSHGVKIVEDAAHAFGSSHRGRMLGSFGDLTCFSFDPIKVVTCGEGGAVAFSDESFADLIRQKRLLGMDKSSWQRQKDTRDWSYKVTSQGYRYHMGNMNAAIGLVQLDKLGRFMWQRRSIVACYNEAFRGFTGIQTLDWDIAESCPFAYVVRITNGQRDKLAEYLKERDIGTGIHYIPNHLQPYFNIGDVLPTTEQIYNEILTLPLHCELTEDDVEHVISSVRTFFGGDK